MRSRRTRTMELFFVFAKLFHLSALVQRDLSTQPAETSSPNCEKNWHICTYSYWGEGSKLNLIAWNSYRSTLFVYFKMLLSWMQLFKMKCKFSDVSNVRIKRNASLPQPFLKVNTWSFIKFLCKCRCVWGYRKWIHFLNIIVINT